MCTPAASEEGEKAAAPEATATVARTVLPSETVTVPGAAAFMVALSVPTWPATGAFGLTPTFSPTNNLTDCERTAEVEPVSAASPPYTALIECVPCVRAEVANEAEPFERVPVPRTVAPSRNCTTPVAVPRLTAALNVTAPPTNEGFHVDVSATEVLVFTTSLIVLEEKLWAYVASPR